MVASEDLVDVGPVLKESSRTSSIRVFDQLDGFTNTDASVSLRSKVSKWCGVRANQARDGAKNFSVTDWIALAVPCVSWLKKYSVWIFSLEHRISPRCSLPRMSSTLIGVATS